MDHDAQIGVHQRIVSQSLQAIRGCEVRGNEACMLLEITALPQCAPSALVGVEFILEMLQGGTAAEKRGRLQLVTLSSSEVPGFRYLIPTASGVKLLTTTLRFASSHHTPGVKLALFRFLPLGDAGELSPPPSSRRSLIPRALTPASNIACVTCTWEGKQFRFPNRLFRPQ